MPAVSGRLGRLLARRTARVRVCAVCGRKIPANETIELLDPRPCSNCGSRLRQWDRQPPGIFETARACWDLLSWWWWCRVAAPGPKP
jgi:DNA-directed RNA polymerase subunit RPC12/RpoP